MDKHDIEDAQETINLMKTGDYNTSRDPETIFNDLSNVIVYLNKRLEELEEIRM